MALAGEAQGTLEESGRKNCRKMDKLNVSLLTCHPHGGGEREPNRGGGTQSQVTLRTKKEIP